MCRNRHFGWIIGAILGIAIIVPQAIVWYLLDTLQIMGLGISWCLCKLFSACCWCFRFPTGQTLVGRESGQLSGIPPLATLLTLAVGQSVGILWAHYERIPTVYSIMVFTVVAVIVLGGMVGILRAKLIKNDQEVPVFDGATVNSPFRYSLLPRGR
jgi:hypothetical protein